MFGRVMHGLVLLSPIPVMWGLITAVDMHFEPHASVLMPAAHADPGGQMPGPSLCDYPGVGSSGMEFGFYHYVCDFPTEINGSRWHCDYLGAVGQATAGVSLFIFNASLTTPVGVLEGRCDFVCPDLSISKAPNPPGAWKSFINPQKCEAVAAPIQLIPIDTSAEMPAVTNPVAPNPEQTVNPN